MRWLADVRARRFEAVACVVMAVSATPALAQATDPQALLDAFNQADGQTAGRIIQLAGLLTILSLAPGLVVTLTSFTRIVIALSFLRAGLGLPTTPSNLIVITLALFMTGFIMAPVFEQANRDGLQPLIAGQITEEEALPRIAEPFRAFMTANVRDSDLKLFEDLAGTEPTGPDEAIPYRILIPAFLISELRRGFEIGFLILLPFLVIDLVVATLTMSMGMMMLPPTVLSLPFKILFFVLIDGWNLLVGSLVKSFAGI
ncbi:MAG: flagellar type III secretion system pore protein FliP [Rhizobiaceae bacterium]|jgi:flagellar biosynthetic protein FliP|nr:flagellar type III secretion system pore protein FliP [Rhizobiaceae bacterium]